MSDRKLLELAAKAAGIRLEWDGPPNKWQPMYYEDKTYHVFDPLTDDGDALRLMVRLRLEPRIIDNSHSNGAEPSRVTLHNVAGIVEDIGGDPLAATRRAIVRAAAEIGRQMP